MWTDVMTGELLGTTCMILLGGGVVANAMLRGTKGAGSSWLMINAGWGFAVMVGVLVSTSSGSPFGDLNPAVTVAKYLLGIHDTVREVLEMMAAQMIGCFLGAVLVWLTYLPHWKITPDGQRKRSVFCTDPAVTKWWANIATEAVATLVLIFVIGALVNNALISDGWVPYAIGGIVWSIGLSLGGPTGNAMNPARDLAPRIAYWLLPIPDKGSCGWQYAWIPIAGPLLGASLAAGLRALLW